MKFLKTAIVAIALLVAGTIAFRVGMVSAQTPELSSTPPWVQPNGIIDESKLPECFEVVGPDGQTVQDETGRNVCIPSHELFAPPPVSPEDVDNRGVESYINQEGIEVQVLPVRRPAESMR